MLSFTNSLLGFTPHLGCPFFAPKTANRQFVRCTFQSHNQQLKYENMSNLRSTAYCYIAFSPCVWPFFVVYPIGVSFEPEIRQRIRFEFSWPLHGHVPRWLTSTTKIPKVSKYVSDTVLRSSARLANGISRAIPVDRPHTVGLERKKCACGSATRIDDTIYVVNWCTIVASWPPSHTHASFVAESKGRHYLHVGCLLITYHAVREASIHWWYSYAISCGIRRQWSPAWGCQAAIGHTGGFRYFDLAEYFKFCVVSEFSVEPRMFFSWRIDGERVKLCVYNFCLKNVAGQCCTFNDAVTVDLYQNGVYDLMNAFILKLRYSA